MKYLCLIYDSEALWDAMPEQETGPIMAEYRAFTQQIMQSGHFVSGHQLQPTPAATSVRIRNGKTVVTDGPFAETKEQLGGYFLVECDSIEEAVELGAQIPAAQSGGCVEARPIHEEENR